MNIVLENARKLHKENPDTFHRDITGVVTGSFVKICQLDIEQAERFWIEVTKINGTTITGEVRNQLLYSPIQYGDTLVVELDNIYEVFTGTPGTGNEKDNVRGVCETCNGE